MKLFFRMFLNWVKAKRVSCKMREGWKLESILRRSDKDNIKSLLIRISVMLLSRGSG